MADWAPKELRDKRPVMLIGIDINHTLIREENSVVAVVASMNPDFTQVVLLIQNMNFVFLIIWKALNPEPHSKFHIPENNIHNIYK
jgi:hypothetical protein